MKIGIAGMRPWHQNRISFAKSIGYDFIESGLSALSTIEQSEIDEFGVFLKEIKMPCASTNGMFPPEIKLIGREADREIIKDYMYNAFDKIKILECPVCVLGSGGARCVPEGYSLDEAYDEFTQLVSDVIAPIIEEYGKTLAIEPLNFKECNIVNTVADSMRVVKAVNKPSVTTLIDYYHVMVNGEDIEEFVQYKGYIKHVHIASRGRYYPRPYYGDDYKGFFDVLRRAEYKEQNVSIEAAIFGGDSDIGFKNAAISALSLLKSL